MPSHRNLKRLALEFLLPPLLASLPIGLSTAWAASQGGEHSPLLVFGAFFGVWFGLAAIPSLLSTVLAETALRHRRGGMSRKAAGLWALFGLAAGVVIAKTLLAGDLLLTAVTYAVAWGLTGLLVTPLAGHLARRATTTRRLPHHPPFRRHRVRGHS